MYMNKTKTNIKVKRIGYIIIVNSSIDIWQMKPPVVQCGRKDHFKRETVLQSLVITHCSWFNFTSQPTKPIAFIATSAIAATFYMFYFISLD